MSQQSKMLALPSTSSGRDDDVLDALPYIDDVGYTEEHRAFALQLIEAECRTFARTKNYLKHMPEPDYDKFLTPRMLDEFKRMSEKKEPDERMDFTRYDVQSPANTSRQGDKKAWKSAIDNCRAQLASQSLRQINLEILDEYGPQSHLRFNDILGKQLGKEEAEAYKLRSQIYELNSRRKRTQVEAGEKLNQLGQSWVALVTKNAEMEMACMQMEAEIRQLAKRQKVDPGLDKLKIAE